VPADVTVGVGRTATIIAPEGAKEKKEMNPQDVAKLFARAAEFGIEPREVEKLVAQGEGAEAKLEGMIVEKLRKEVAELKARKPDILPAAGPAVIGADVKKEVAKRYSLLNLCRKMAGAKVDTGFEEEVSQEIYRLGGMQRKGEIAVPWAAFLPRERATALLESDSTATVATNLLAGEFIEVLRPYAILPKLGARVMSGLVGNVSIPKQTSAGAGYWVSENTDVTRLAPGLGAASLQIHTVGAACDISWLMNVQSTPSAEQLVRDDIMKSIATKVEAAVFSSGGAGAPTPLPSVSGVNNPSIGTPGTPTYAEILDFYKEILADGAAADGMKWAISAATWATLAATYNDGTTKSYPVLDPVTKTLIGFPYEVSENVGTYAAFLGDWSQLIIGTWGAGIEVRRDESTLSLAGGVRLVGLLGVDIAVRHPQAFAYNTTVSGS